jgi:hypothetical protein
MTEEQLTCDHEWGELNDRTWVIRKDCAKCGLSFNDHLKLTIAQSVSRDTEED